MHTIRLFLDKNSLTLTGNSALLNWHVRNEGSAPVEQLQISIRAIVDDPDLQLLAGNDRNSIRLAPGQSHCVHSGLKVARSLRCALEVQLRGLNGHGAFFLSATSILGFTLPDPGVTTTIEVADDALLKRINTSGPLHVKVGKSALLKDLDLGGQANVEHAEHSSTEEALIPLTLSDPGLPGLYPLNLDQIASHWPRLSRALQIDFVDVSGRPTAHARVAAESYTCDLYRARIVTVQPGYLTLIAQGASGNCYLMAPNPAGSGNSVLPPGSHFFPGPLLLDVNQLGEQQRRWYFSPPAGEERLFAILTRTPLWPQAMPIASPLTEAAAVQLIIHAMAQSDSLVALARITTMEA